MVSESGDLQRYIEHRVGTDHAFAIERLRSAESQLQAARQREAALVECLKGYHAIYFFAERCPYCFGMPQRFCEKHATSLTELYQEIAALLPQGEHQAQQQATCPQCQRPLKRVAQEANSPLNSEQFDAVKSGDYVCDHCLVYWFQGEQLLRSHHGSRYLDEKRRQRKEDARQQKGERP